MSNVIRFPTEKTEAEAIVRTLTEMLAAGDVKEVIIYAPNVKDPSICHFAASGDIELWDVVMAKQYLAVLANKLCEVQE